MNGEMSRNELRDELTLVDLRQVYPGCHCNPTQAVGLRAAWAAGTPHALQVLVGHPQRPTMHLPQVLGSLV